jgi:hypothetical protein
VSEVKRPAPVSAVWIKLTHRHIMRRSQLWTQAVKKMRLPFAVRNAWKLGMWISENLSRFDVMNRLELPSIAKANI